MDEVSVITLVRAGNTDAFAEIVEQYQAPIQRYLYRLTALALIGLPAQLWSSYYLRISYHIYFLGYGNWKINVIKFLKAIKEKNVTL